jgi:predicted nucleic acid-binding protein
VIVVDASAIVDLLLGRKAAAAVRERMVAAGLVCSPEVIDPEVLNALRRWLLTGLLRPYRADQAVARFATLPVRRRRHGPLRGRAWQLRNQFTAYDALYVALAERLGATLLTSDRRMARAAGPLVDVALAG